jgi:hypothetical protein
LNCLAIDRANISNKSKIKHLQEDISENTIKNILKDVLNPYEYKAKDYSQPIPQYDTAFQNYHGIRGNNVPRVAGKNYVINIEFYSYRNDTKIYILAFFIDSDTCRYILYHL